MRIEQEKPDDEVALHDRATRAAIVLEGGEAAQQRPPLRVVQRDVGPWLGGGSVGDLAGFAAAGLALEPIRGQSSDLFGLTLARASELLRTKAVSAVDLTRAADRGRVVDDPLGKVHDGDVDFVARAAMADGVVLRGIAPAEDAGLERLFFELTTSGESTPSPHTDPIHPQLGGATA